MEREATAGRVQFIAGRDQDSWQRKIAAGCDVDRLQLKIAAGSFLPQRIAVGCEQGGWQPEIAVGNVVQQGIAAERDQVAAGCDQGRWQREMRAAIEGIREIGWLFLVGFGAAILWSFGCDLARVAAIVGIAWKGGSGRDGSKGSRNAAVIPDDRTPERAL
ncbi:hypothetical protein B296_00015338 [Ensete ventricosum]|uniref:Uncharacterized protein n=1 Tax=Ensete ventricosum TaxID=4639 RepID=A0A426YYW3_ENSVE|nr:hypothetical protein B296_00015338 [Ensete ventricosum]